MPNLLKRKAIINASADDVWQTVSTFDNVEKFIPLFSHSSLRGSGVGARRTCVIQNGGQIFELLEKLDDEKLFLQYSLIASPMPLARYTNTMKIRDIGENQCEIVWTTTFKPKGASEVEIFHMLDTIISMGMDGLRKLHGNDSLN